MRKEINELITRWKELMNVEFEEADDFMEKHPDFDPDNDNVFVKYRYPEYKKLMADSVKVILGEWGNEKISKDICMLLMQMCKLWSDVMPFDEMEIGEAFRMVKEFHNTFMEKLLEDALDFTEDGMIKIENEIIDPITFVIPSIDGWISIWN